MCVRVYFGASGTVSCSLGSFILSPRAFDAMDRLNPMKESWALLIRQRKDDFAGQPSDGKCSNMCVGGQFHVMDRLNPKAESWALNTKCRNKKVISLGTK